MKTLFTVLFIAVCIILTVVVLLQEGKDRGLGSIGGIGDTYWSRNRSRSMEGNLAKLTKGMIVLFFVLAILINIIHPHAANDPDAQDILSTEQISTESELSGSTEADAAYNGMTESESAIVISATETEAGTEG